MIGPVVPKPLGLKGQWNALKFIHLMLFSCHLMSLRLLARFRLLLRPRTEDSNGSQPLRHTTNGNPGVSKLGNKDRYEYD